MSEANSEGVEGESLDVECVDNCRHSSAFVSGCGLELVRGDVAEAGVHPLLVVEMHVAIQRGFGLQERRVAVGPDFLLLQGALEALDEGVVGWLARSGHAHPPSGGADACNVFAGGVG